MFTTTTMSTLSLGISGTMLYIVSLPKSLVVLFVEGLDKGAIKTDKANGSKEANGQGPPFIVHCLGFIVQCSLFFKAFLVVVHESPQCQCCLGGLAFGCGRQCFQ